MTNTIFDVFRIDRLGKRIFSKILFTFALLVGMSVYVCPIGDTDFTQFLVFMQNAMEDMDLLMNMQPSDIPLTTGNIIYILHILASDFLLIFSSFIYTGVYIRQYRLEHKNNEPGDSGYLIPPRFLIPSSVSKLVLRMVIVFCFSLIIFIPASFVVLYLFLIFIIILPYVGMYPACYLSGDSGFWHSFIDMVKVTKGYYLVNARNMLLIISLYFVGNWLTSSLVLFLPSVAYVTGPLFNAFLALSYGRYVGMVYCRMREIPGGYQRVSMLRPEASDK